jgi:hypothetical protein
MITILTKEQLVIQISLIRKDIKIMNNIHEVLYFSTDMQIQPNPNKQL